MNSDLSGNLSKIPCRKCKSMPSTALRCIKCNSLNHPSCLKLLKNIQYLNDTTVICCETTTNPKNEPDPPQKLELSKNEMEDLVGKVTQPLLHQIELLRGEVQTLKESNVELVKFLSDNHGPKFVKRNFDNKKLSINVETTDEDRCLEQSSRPNRRKRKSSNENVEDDVERKPRRNGTVNGTVQVDNGFGAWYVKRAWYYMGKMVPNVDFEAIRSFIADKFSSDELMLILGSRVAY
ncbi:uncharacterized protein LOC135128295 isoform X1 [Zophobas morio]|uniref:uncharacterized protein LOC135128295 isoform X1 n=1 Tax=Zophobas morio TaxID=2755281 RepID=UPI003082E3E5